MKAAATLRDVLAAHVARQIAASSCSV